ncbi:MAG: hypothetical protein HS111_35620 [Kofleriaceae bacterium]|nr:hypothetical protein [Kofleriaceae bacterium]
MDAWAARGHDGRTKELAMYVITGVTGNTGAVVADTLLTAGSRSASSFATPPAPRPGAPAALRSRWPHSRTPPP